MKAPSLLATAALLAAGVAPPRQEAVVPAPGEIVARRPQAVEPQRRPVAFRDRVLPAPVNGGYREKGYWVWCGSVAKGDDGRFHCSPRAGPAGWMAVNGEAIHRTLASSMPQPSWGRFTQRGDTLYAHVFEWPRDLPLFSPWTRATSDHRAPRAGGRALPGLHGEQRGLGPGPAATEAAQRARFRASRRPALKSVGPNHGQIRLVRRRGPGVVCGQPRRNR